MMSSAWRRASSMWRRPASAASSISRRRSVWMSSISSWLASRTPRSSLLTTWSRAALVGRRLRGRLLPRRLRRHVGRRRCGVLLERGLGRRGVLIGLCSRLGGLRLAGAAELVGDRAEEVVDLLGVVAGRRQRERRVAHGGQIDAPRLGIGQRHQEMIDLLRVVAGGGERKGRVTNARQIDHGRDASWANAGAAGWRGPKSPSVSAVVRNPLEAIP